MVKEIDQDLADENKEEVKIKKGTPCQTYEKLQLEYVTLNGYGMGENLTIIQVSLHREGGQKLPIFPILP